MLLPRLSSLFGLIGLASAVLAASPSHSSADFALVRRASSSNVNTVAAELTSEITATTEKVKGYSKAVIASAKTIEKLLKDNAKYLHQAGSGLQYPVNLADLEIRRALLRNVQKTYTAIADTATFAKNIRSSSSNVNFKASVHSDAVISVSDAFGGLSLQLHATLQPYLELASSSSLFLGLLKRTLAGISLEYLFLLDDVAGLGDLKNGTLGYNVAYAFSDKYTGSDSFYHDYGTLLEYLQD